MLKTLEKKEILPNILLTKDMALDRELALSASFSPKSPAGLERHQQCLKAFCSFMMNAGIEIRLPRQQGWDRGVDVYVGDGLVAVDVKSFGCWEADPQWRTWKTDAYRGYRKPEGSLCEVILHMERDTTPATWKWGRWSNLKESKFADGRPYWQVKDYEAFFSFLSKV